MYLTNGCSTCSKHHRRVRKVVKFGTRSNWKQYCVTKFHPINIKFVSHLLVRLVVWNGPYTEWHATLWHAYRIMIGNWLRILNANVLMVFDYTTVFRMSSRFWHVESLLIGLLWNFVGLVTKWHFHCTISCKDAALHCITDALFIFGHAGMPFRITRTWAFVMVRGTGDFRQKSLLYHKRKCYITWSNKCVQTEKSTRDDIKQISSNRAPSESLLTLSNGLLVLNGLRDGESDQIQCRLKGDSAYTGSRT